MPTHTEAIQFVIDALTDDKTEGVVKVLTRLGQSDTAWYTAERSSQVL